MGIMWFFNVILDSDWKNITCLVDSEQTTKHKEDVKHKGNSTEYHLGSLQFLGEGEKKMPLRQ